MFLGQLGRNVPVVQQNTAVDSFLVLSQPFIALDGVVSHACELEPISELVEQRVVLRYFFDDLGQAIIVL